jgi:hypothetical protein
LFVGALVPETHAPADDLDMATTSRPCAGQ